MLGQGAAVPGSNPGGFSTHSLAPVMGARLHGTGSPYPVAPAAGSDKISRSGGCSTAWLVRAGSWMAALPVSRRVMSHHPGHSYQAHPTWTVASKDRHLSRGSSVLSCGEGRDSARHSHVPVSLSVSKAYSQCHDPPSSPPPPTFCFLPGCGTGW